MSSSLIAVQFSGLLEQPLRACYESLNFYLRLILWTMLLRQNLHHNTALEYCGKVFQYKFVTVGKNFEYKISKMLLDVCYDLSLWWHLPNWDIAFKQIKIVKKLKTKLLVVLCS
jgi:hypothetical protein